jgi:uncharacterized membrane protein YtjA (UPF0391 family)
MVAQELTVISIAIATKAIANVLFILWYLMFEISLMIGIRALRSPGDSKEADQKRIREDFRRDWRTAQNKA